MVVNGEEPTTFGLRAFILSLLTAIIGQRARPPPNVLSHSQPGRNRWFQRRKFRRAPLRVYAQRLWRRRRALRLAFFESRQTRVRRIQLLRRTRRGRRGSDSGSQSDGKPQGCTRFRAVPSPMPTSEHRVLHRWQYNTHMHTSKRSNSPIGKASGNGTTLLNASSAAQLQTLRPALPSCPRATSSAPPCCGSCSSRSRSSRSSPPFSAVMRNGEVSGSDIGINESE